MGDLNGGGRGENESIFKNGFIKKFKKIIYNLSVFSFTYCFTLYIYITLFYILKLKTVKQLIFLNHSLQIGSSPRNIPEIMILWPLSFN